MTDQGRPTGCAARVSRSTESRNASKGLGLYEDTARDMEAEVTEKWRETRVAAAAVGADPGTVAVVVKTAARMLLLIEPRKLAFHI